MVQTVNNRSGDGNIAFPSEILSAPNDMRQEYYKNYVVEHPFLMNAVDETIDFISAHVPERLVFVCGPAGVGKNEFVKLFKKRVMELSDTKLAENPGCIPIACVEAKAPDKGSFNFPNLWEMVLEELKEPMLGNKISHELTEFYDSSGYKRIQSKPRKADFFGILQRALIYRDASALLINEAHHMLNIVGGNRINMAVDILKSLSNGSQTPIILIGTYELLAFLACLNTSKTDQLNRRTRIVNFPRYDITTEDIIVFGKVARKLLQNMPLEKTAEYLADEEWKYLYTYSLGCIGNLKVWFMDAYYQALKEGSKTLTKKHLEMTKMSAHLLQGMAEEIAAGEKEIATIFSDRNFEIKLESNNPDKESQSQTDEVVPKVKSKALKPFERLPKRDAVG